MTTQIKRSTLFLVGNLAISATCVAAFAPRIAQDPSLYSDNRVWWARAVLLYVIAQIVFRILAMIALAFHNAATGETEEVIGSTSSIRISISGPRPSRAGASWPCFLAALATQAVGLPLRWSLRRPRGRHDRLRRPWRRPRACCITAGGTERERNGYATRLGGIGSTRTR
jgi:hypothetical protein